MKKVTEVLSKLSADQVHRQQNGNMGTGYQSPSVTVSPPEPAVIQPTGGPHDKQGDTSNQHRQAKLHVPIGLSATQQNMKSWAEAATSSASFPPLSNHGHGVQGVGGRGDKVYARRRLDSTASQKRAREEEEQQFDQFKLYQSRNQVRKQRKVAFGSSQVNIEEEGSAAPVDFYIGNTTPRATKEIVQSVLIKCAKGVEADTRFSVVEVVQLATHIVNPRTKCWKVVIPYKYKQMMEKDELYPPGWTHRKFFGARAANTNPAKQGRQDDLIVNEVMREEERKKVEESRLSEERKLREEASRLDAEKMQMDLDKITEEENEAEKKLAAELAETLKSSSQVTNSQA